MSRKEEDTCLSLFLSREVVGKEVPVIRVPQSRVGVLEQIGITRGSSGVEVTSV